MSSMFKKRTAGGFKPKVGPRARPAAGPSASAAAATPSVSSAPTTLSPSADSSVSLPASTSASVVGSPTPTSDTPQQRQQQQQQQQQPQSEKLPEAQSEKLPEAQSEKHKDALPAVSAKPSTKPIASSSPALATSRSRPRPRLLAKNPATTTTASATGISVTAADSAVASTSTANSATASPPATEASSPVTAQNSAPVALMTPTISMPLKFQYNAAHADNSGNTSQNVNAPSNRHGQKPTKSPATRSTAPAVTTSTPESDAAAPLYSAPQLYPAVPSLDSLPDLRVAVSTPSVTDDSQPTPADSANVSEAGSETGLDVSQPAPVTSSRKRKSPSSSTAAVSASVTTTTATTNNNKRPRQRQPRVHVSIEHDHDNTAADTDVTPSSSMRRARRRRRMRSETPPDSELQTIDLQKLTMADLTRDLRIGKKFSRHNELKERERERRIRAKTGGATPGVAELAPLGRPSATDVADEGMSSAATAAAGPQFRVVNGQIVVDQNSLVVDRHAHAALLREDMEEIEENDFTRLITSNSFRTGSKLRGPNHWTPEDTEKFYHALAMFGTDFEMISSMFPGRTRRHVKMKFNREERLAPGRINAALVGEKRVTIDMEAYAATTGVEYETVEAIEAEQQALADEHDAEERRVAAEHEAEMQRKRAELFRDEERVVDENGIETIVDSGTGPIFFGQGRKRRG
ncbi:hypothetical protein TD95_003610 [Thielaviopsis punctulata]|uniref:Myb-like domain-containing protein n=1 Tax=Thielaviopsis punctulata TaxID=72032 RepID=A0A0F4ZDU8_9PEZI|nr:hypothetical protein TD95_003610 [Thielaviopsis punctulata]